MEKLGDGFVIKTDKDPKLINKIINHELITVTQHPLMLAPDVKLEDRDNFIQFLADRIKDAVLIFYPPEIIKEVKVSLSPEGAIDVNVLLNELGVYNPMGDPNPREEIIVLASIKEQKVAAKKNPRRKKRNETEVK